METKSKFKLVLVTEEFSVHELCETGSSEEVLNRFSAVTNAFALVQHDPCMLFALSVNAPDTVRATVLNRFLDARLSRTQHRAAVNLVTSLLY